MADFLQTVTFCTRRPSPEFRSCAGESRVCGSHEPSGAGICAGAESQQRWMAPVHAASVLFGERGQLVARPSDRFRAAAQQQPGLVGAPTGTITQRGSFGRKLAAAAEHETADREPAILGSVESAIFGSTDFESALLSAPDFEPALLGAAESESAVLGTAEQPAVLSAAEQPAVFGAACAAFLSAIGRRLSRCPVGRRISWRAQWRRTFCPKRWAFSPEQRITRWSPLTRSLSYLRAGAIEVASARSFFISA